MLFWSNLIVLALDYGLLAGGAGADYGYSCVTDYTGNIYLAGSTWSDNNISSNGFQNSKGAPGGIGAYLAKFNSSGTRQWGTYYGGIFSTEGRWS